MSEVGDLGLTWNQLKTVDVDRQVAAKRMSSEMARAHQRGEVQNRESLRRRLGAMIK